MKKTLSYILFVIFGVLLSIGCHRDIFYEQMNALPKEQWNITDTLFYAFEITDTLQEYTLYMDIRNTIDFQTQNLYLFMDSEDPLGECHRDTLQFLLTDAHGNWKGEGSGRFKEYQYLFYPRVRFPHTGTYKFSFVQAMRADAVKGIANFGLTICYFDEKRFQK